MPARLRRELDVGIKKSDEQKGNKEKVQIAKIGSIFVYKIKKARTKERMLSYHQKRWKLDPRKFLNLIDIDTEYNYN